jgi:hypothetical protein
MIGLTVERFLTMNKLQKLALIELLHTEIQELQNELAIPDSYLIDIYKMVEELRGEYYE